MIDEGCADMADEKANSGVVLVSGGLDSLVTLSIAMKECDDVAALHASYGQRTAARERKAFEDICMHYHVSNKAVIDLSHIAAFGGSSLTSAVGDIPSGPSPGGIPTTYVPFRNANLLAAAVSWAEAMEADAVYIGVVEEDSSGYPDCRREFIRNFQRVVEEGTRPTSGIIIRVPLISLNRDQIVRLGVGFDAPFELSWSCYRNNGGKACGKCESCLIRLRGFHRAGIEDPIEYEEIPDESRKFIEA
jgi:7-cyano-7-deazaguanine synthase